MPKRTNTPSLVSVVLRAAILISLIIIPGCGGGGGGGGGGSGSQPGEASGPTLIALDTANGADVISGSLGSYGSLLELAAFSATSFQQVKNAASASPVIACDKPGGSMTSTFLDVNGNGAIDSGDQLTLVYSNCNSSFMGGDVTGTLVLDIKSFSQDSVAGLWGLNATATLNISATQVGGSISLSGKYVLEYQLGPHGDSLAIQDAGSALKLNGASNVNFIAFNISKTLNSDLSSYSFGGSVTIANADSTLSYRCATQANYHGIIDSPADSGTNKCFGAGNTSVIATMQSGGHQPVTLTAGNGDTTKLAERFFDVSDLSFLVSTILFKQPYGESSNAIVSAVLPPNTQVADFAVAEGVGRVFVITNANPPLANLFEIDPSSGTVVKTIALQNRPASLAVTFDGASAYVGYSDISTIDKIDLQLGQVVQQIGVGTQLETFSQTVNPLFASHIIVSPTNPDLIAVQTAFIKDFSFANYYAFLNGVRLSNSFYSINFYFAFSSDGARAFTSEATGGGSILVDSNGLTETQTGLANIDGGLDYYDNQLVTSFGKIFDGHSLNPIADLSSDCSISLVNGGACGLYLNTRHVIHDPYLDRLYFTGYGGLTVFGGKSLYFLNQNSTVSIDGVKSLNRNQLTVGGVQFIGKNTLYK